MLRNKRSRWPEYAAIQQQQREREFARWASWETMQARKRHTEKKYAPSPSSVTSHQSSHYQTQRYAKVFELYNSLVHGDPNTPRTVPFDLAKSNGLSPNAISAIEQEVAEKDRREKEDFHKTALQTNANTFRQFIEFRQGVKQARAECVWQEIANWKNSFHYSGFDFGATSYGDTIRLLRQYVVLLEYPSVQGLLMPYYTARFSQPWRDHFPNTTEMQAKILNEIESFRRSHLWVWEQKQADKGQSLISRLLRVRVYASPEAHYGRVCNWYFLLKTFQEFLEHYGEGAIIVLVLLHMVLLQPLKNAPAGKYWYWNNRSYPEPADWHPTPNEVVAEFGYGGRIRRFPLPKICNDGRERNLYERYQGFNVLYLPSLINHEPLEILLLLERLSETISSLNNEDTFSKYSCLDDRAMPDWHDWNILPSYKATYKGQFNKELQQNRDDLQLLRTEAHRRFDWHWEKIKEGNNLWWVECEDLVRTYLQCRACDIARYGERVADRTFPQPTIKGATATQVAQLVSSFVTLLQEYERQNEKREDEDVSQELENTAQEGFNSKFSNQMIPMPDIHLHALTDNEIEALKAACLKKLRQSEK